MYVAYSTFFPPETVISLCMRNEADVKTQMREDSFEWNLPFRVETESQTHPPSSAPHKCV